MRLSGSLLAILTKSSVIVFTLSSRTPVKYSKTGYDALRLNPYTLNILIHLIQHSVTCAADTALLDNLRINNLTSPNQFRNISTNLLSAKSIMELSERL
jgi:hypothetical protein